jgi:hypothetical protein
MVINYRAARIVALAMLGLALAMAGSWSIGPVTANSIDYEDAVTSAPYQGRLTVSDGQPVADGTYDFRLALYNAESGGTLLWTETQTGVHVRDGYFGLLLGDVTPLGQDIAAQERYLSVAVRGPDDDDFTTLEPRQKLVGPQADIHQPNCPTGTSADHDHCGDAWMNCNGLAIYGEDDGSTMLFVENTGTSNGTKAIWGYANGLSGQVYGLHGQINSSTAGASAVYGQTQSGQTYGVYGRTFSNSDWSRGVYGHASASSGLTVGVQGQTDSTSEEARGVYGWAGATSGKTFGVLGMTNSGTNFATGVRGNALSSNGLTYGLYGKSNGDEGRGVYGYASATSGARYGVAGSVEGSGYGLASWDDLYVTGDCVGCTIVFIGQNSGTETLRVGDVVAASGVGAVLRGHTSPVLEARKATSDDLAVLGVIYSRGEFYPASGEQDEDWGDSVQPVEGDVAPGDYMFIVTSGLAQVRVAPSVDGLAPGQSLTVARVAGSATLAGTETAPGLIFARAMEAQADEDGLIWAMVGAR